MTKLFLFDLDGTLVKTGGAGLRALNRAYQDLYQVPEAMHSYNPAGKTDPAIFRELVRLHFHRDLEPGEMDRISSRYLSFLEEEMANKTARVLTGVSEFVDVLSRREDVLIALGTGNLEKGARLKLNNTGLNDVFPLGGFGSDSEDRAEMLKAGHRRVEKNAGRAIPSNAVYVIGDTCLDITAARRAGYRAVAVASGSVSHQDLSNASPDFLMTDMSEGFQLLDRLSATVPL